MTSTAIMTREDAARAEPLSEEDRSEALDFLAERALHTVGMAGFILENGVESLLNRGCFYGCRDDRGRLEGVALIGHATLFEARTEGALASLARRARACRSKYMIMGEREEVERFWAYYAAESESPRMVCYTVLMEQPLPAFDFGSAHSLRAATKDDLELIVAANAGIIMAEHGVNPLDGDPEGFRLRCSRRIERGKTWVWVDNGRLLFKADLEAATPAATYIEGVYVCPEEKGRGYGRRGMSELARRLEGKTKALCGLVATRNTMARAFYEMMGYRPAADYATFFLDKDAA